MKKILLSLTPDIILGLLKFLHSMLAIVGIVSKPKDPVKESVPHEVAQEDVEDEIDSIFNLADENALPQGDDVWEPTDLEDVDDVMSDLQGINSKISDSNLDDHDISRHLRAGQKVEAIKSVRRATGWNLKDARGFVDTVQKHELHNAA